MLRRTVAALRWRQGTLAIVVAALLAGATVNGRRVADAGGVCEPIHLADTDSLAGNDDHAEAIALQSDGKIVIAATTHLRGFAPPAVVLVRYAVDGRLDGSFGDAGIVRTSLVSMVGASHVIAVAVERGGRIVVAGEGPGRGRKVILEGYLPDGKSDASFGTAGALGTALAVPAGSLLVEADGALLIAGAADREPLMDFGLARFTPDGHPDRAFGLGGRVTTPVGSTWVSSVARLRDGKLVAAGLVEVRDIALARYRSDGGLDASFGNGGIVVTSLDPYVPWMALDTPSVAAGPGDSLTVAADSWLLHYRADGTLDPAFGHDGILQLPPGEEARMVLAQPGGRVLVVGRRTPGRAKSSSFLLRRYEADGTLDRRFGERGRVLTHFADQDEARAVAVQPDGRLVVAGDAGTAGVSDIAVARYNAEGRLDPSFGVWGRAMTDVVGRHDPLASFARISGTTCGVPPPSTCEQSAPRLETRHPLLPKDAEQCSQPPERTKEAFYRVEGSPTPRTSADAPLELRLTGMAQRTTTEGLGLHLTFVNRGPAPLVLLRPIGSAQEPSYDLYVRDESDGTVYRKYVSDVPSDLITDVDNGSVSTRPEYYVELAPAEQRDDLATGWGGHLQWATIPRLGTYTAWVVYRFCSFGAPPYSPGIVRRGDVYRGVHASNGVTIVVRPP